MQKVFVLDSNKQPLMPCHPARARELLNKGRAAVYRRSPFTIILKDREGGEVQETQETQFKIDPGVKTSGLALVANFKRGLCCIWAGELTHRGWAIKDALLSRRQLRRGLRQMCRKVKKWEHIVRVAVRVSASFNIRTSTQTIQEIGYKYCQSTQRADGYAYT